jgi:hypothetical protein
MLQEIIAKYAILWLEFTIKGKQGEKNINLSLAPSL